MGDMSDSESIYCLEGTGMTLARGLWLGQQVDVGPYPPGLLISMTT